jgi:hypothetical protein
MSSARLSRLRTDDLYKCDDIFISDKGGFSNAYFHIYSMILHNEKHFDLGFKH